MLQYFFFIKRDYSWKFYVNEHFHYAFGSPGLLFVFFKSVLLVKLALENFLAL
jgi:hypothetical protein